MSWLELSVRVREGSKDPASGVFWALGAQGVQEDHEGLHFDDGDGPLIAQGAWELGEIVNPGSHVLLKAFFEGIEDADALKARAGAALSDLAEVEPVTTRQIANEDWSQAWKARWTTVQLTDRLRVVPSWEERPELPPGQHAILMDPGMAFGTGTHSTTQGCLVLAERWLTGGERVLDVGTGTGILAFGALLLGASEAVGVDTEAEAVAAAGDNASLNGLADRFTVHRGSVEQDERAFELVFGNLLAPLLVRLARPLTARVGDGGTLIVSGLLHRQEAEVVAAMAEQGFAVVDTWRSAEWSALRLERA